MFDTVRAVIPAHELEQLRRSAAFDLGASTSVGNAELVALVSELLDRRHQAKRHDAEVDAIMARLLPAFTEVRAALNELHQGVSGATARYRR